MHSQDEAEAGCEVDYETFSRKGSDCTRLESFESFIRGLLGHSPMSSFAHLLYTLRKAELHEASADPTTGKLAGDPMGHMIFSQLPALEHPKATRA